MLDRLFTAASVLFLTGTIVFLTGLFLIPGWSPVTLPAGVLTMSASGMAMAISGSLLILNANGKA